MAQPPVSNQSQEQRVPEFVSAYQALRAEVGKIIVAEVAPARVAELVAPDSHAQ